MPNEPGVGTLEGQEDGFSYWSSRYERGLIWNIFFKTLHRRFVRKVKPRPGDRILDVGCGTGAVTRRLARDGARVTGIDNSKSMLQVARGLTEGSKDLSFVEAPVESLPFESGSFDCLTTAFAFHHFREPEKGLREMLRVLKPGGRLFVCDVTSDGMISRLILRMYHRNLERRGTHIHTEDDRYYRLRELKRIIADSGLGEVKARLICILPWVAVISGTKSR